jgi:hypothetical protein
MKIDARTINFSKDKDNYLKIIHTLDEWQHSKKASTAL